MIEMPMKMNEFADRLAGPDWYKSNLNKLNNVSSDHNSSWLVMFLITSMYLMVLDLFIMDSDNLNVT